MRYISKQLEVRYPTLDTFLLLKINLNLLKSGQINTPLWMGRGLMSPSQAVNSCCGSGSNVPQSYRH